MSTKEKLRLNTMMGTYPKTNPLKEGRVRLPDVDLEFAPIEVAQTAFKDVVRELKYDVAELAIVTFLQAKAFGTPYVLLPFVMNGGFHHKSILRRAGDVFTAHDLGGRRVAMRSYSQTTPTWVRGILTDDYGVQLKDVAWLATEGAHVAEYSDPPWVERINLGRSLEEALIAGEVDAIIAGGGLSRDATIKPLIDNPKAAAQAWSERYKAVPINHMVVVREDIARDRPEVVRQLFNALCESRRVGETKRSEGPDLQPVGFEAVRPSLELITRYTFEQGLIPRILSTDEMFGSVRQALAGLES